MEAALHKKPWHTPNLKRICSECNHTHPTTPEEFLQFPTSFHTGFEYGVIGEPALQSNAAWDAEPVARRAYEAGYEAGTKAAASDH